VNLARAYCSTPLQTLKSSSPQSTASQLVFVHGAGSSADFWHWQRAAFPDAHYLDLPGHGQWSGASGRATVDAYADWVTDYLRSLGLDDVVLNGHSMGGAIALTLALQRPRWLRAIVLTCTGARLRVSPDLLKLLGEDYEAAVEWIVEMSFAPQRGPLSYAQKVRRNGTRRQLLRTSQEVTLRDYEACEQFDVMDRVSRIELPTLCIVGASDRMTLPKYSEYLRNAITGSRLEIVDGAGHMLPIEKPEEYNRKVAEFLESLDE
jgi:pimeloyl-ACP methyl ester carboxylesterase